MKSQNMQNPYKYRKHKYLASIHNNNIQPTYNKIFLVKTKKITGTFSN